MTRRTPILLTLVALLLGAIGWASTTPTAHAGGPTSVLLTNPALERATARYVTDPDYDRLSAAVGEGSTGDVKPPSTNNSNFGENEVRLTWLIHDMNIWRIDRVHLTRNDGIWVETVADLTGDRDLFDRPARWHRPGDEKALTTLLTGAGLLGADQAPSGPTISQDTSSATTAASPAPSQPVAPIVGGAIGGLVVGVAGSLLLRRRPNLPSRGGVEE
jgi:hypothetical protein